MKISVWSSYYYDLSPEDMVLEFKAHGFNACELSDEHSHMLLRRGDAAMVGAEFAKFLSEQDFEISQGHLFLGERLCDSEGRKKIKRQIDLFLAVGVKNAVLHCDSHSFDGMGYTLDMIREENCKALSDILDYVKGTDMVICLENLITSEIVKSVDGILYFIDYFKSENLGICLDTGHLNMNDKDQVSFIRKAGKLLKALHLNDNQGSSDQHLMPYGKGTINFVPVIQEVKKLGYDGLYNLEIPGENGGPLEIRGYKLDYLKKMMEYLDRQ